MNFSKILRAVFTVITLFIFTGVTGFTDAQARKHPSKNASVNKEKAKKYRRSRAHNKSSRNRRLTRSKKKAIRSKRKLARSKKRLSKSRAHKKYSRRHRVARNKSKRRSRSRKARFNNKTKYRVSAGKRNRRLRHSIFKQSFKSGSIIVSFGDRKLYYFTSAKKVVVYPIGVPRKGFEWKGKTHVSWKTVNPRWTPTKRMREENPKLPEYVEGGTKANPLGVRALYLGKSEYRIHGTNVPWTIGKARSSGCIRMHNSHVIDLYNRVKPKAPVLITWTKYAKSSNKYASTRLKRKHSKRRLRKKRSRKLNKRKLSSKRKRKRRS